MAIALPLPARRRRLSRRLPAMLALVPAAFAVIVVYLGCMLWTVRLSFTSSKLLPTLDFVGFEQYERLWSTERWLVWYTCFSMDYSHIHGGNVRREPRAHYRHWLTHTFACPTETSGAALNYSAVELKYRPVVITTFEPKERVY